jgi:O-antigen/teichoic acid export membrane protein
MSYPADITTYVYIASFTLLFISFSDFYRTIFEANLRMGYNVFARMAFKVVSAGLILWIIFSHGTLIDIMIALVFSESIKTLLNYLFSRKFVRPQFEIDFGLWKHLLKESLPLAMTSVFWVIYYQTDKIMLSMMMDDASVGIYSAAYKLCDPFLLIPSALMISLFPIMSTSFKTSQDRLIKSYKLGLRYLLIIMLPIVIGITLLSAKIILLIYGTEFAYSATVLQILIWSILFGSINSVLLTLLVSIDRQKLNMLSTGIGAIANIALNFFLIPTLSYNGAAIATVGTTVLLFAACFYFVSKHLEVLPVHKILIKPVIGSLIMAAFVYYFIDANIALLVLSAAAVYLVALFALKTFTMEDIAIVKKIVSRK